MVFVNSLKRWLTITETSGLDLDDPETTERRVSIVQRKPFLRSVYALWYRRFAAAGAHTPQGPHVELGSGPGFLQDFIPNVITSEVTPVGHVDIVFSAQAMPFPEASMSAIYLLDVLHHIPQPRLLFSEAIRCLKPGGRLILIEPYNSWWGVSSGGACIMSRLSRRLAGNLKALAPYRMRMAPCHGLYSSGIATNMNRRFLCCA